MRFCPCSDRRVYAVQVKLSEVCGKYCLHSVLNFPLGITVSCMCMLICLHMRVDSCVWGICFVGTVYIYMCKYQYMCTYTHIYILK